MPVDRQKSQRSGGIYMQIFGPLIKINQPRNWISVFVRIIFLVMLHVLGHGAGGGDGGRVKSPWLPEHNFTTLIFAQTRGSKA